MKGRWWALVGFVFLFLLRLLQVHQANRPPVGFWPWFNLVVEAAIGVGFFALIYWGAKLVIRLFRRTKS